MDTTGNVGLDVLADTIADRVWARIQDKLYDRERTELISIPAAAKRLGVKNTKMHAMIVSGDIPAGMVKRIGRRVLIVSTELDRWISAR